MSDPATTPVPVLEMGQVMNAAAKVINARYRTVLTNKHAELRDAIASLDTHVTNLQNALLALEAERRAS